MRRSLSLTIVSAAVAGLIGLATGSALADPSPAIIAALAATMNQPSYHVAITSPRGGTTEADMMKPNKMHLYMKDGEGIVIGSTMYMKMGGKWTKTNVPGLWSDPTDAVKTMQTNHADYASVDLGMSTVGGVPYHAYRVTNSKKHTTETIYVDSAGRLGRIEARGIVIVFSKYGEAISIQPPM
jgi:hypothetical protein